jgi:hypothetical protein
MSDGQTVGLHVQLSNMVHRGVVHAQGDINRGSGCNVCNVQCAMCAIPHWGMFMYQAKHALKYGACGGNVCRQDRSGMEYRKHGMSMSSAVLPGDDYSRLVTDSSTVQAILAEAVRCRDEFMRGA